jgi:uncharacterized protein (UPF0210 family)
MKIRAITLGFPLNSEKGSLDQMKSTLESISGLREKLMEKNIEVQTVRCCTPPFSNETAYKNEFYDEIPERLQYLDILTQKNLLDFYSFLPGLCDQSLILTQTQKRCLKELIPQLKTHHKMFSSVQVSSVKNGISFEAINRCAEIIPKLADKDPFTNLQFAVTFNVPPNTPFFPSAYHIGNNSKISIALEAADEVVSSTEEFSKNNNTLKWLRDSLITRFSQIYDQITEIVKPFCDKNKIEYSGVDFSPSQYPEKNKSIGTAVENIKLSHFGEVGTVFAIGFLTSTLQAINRPKIGFSGFMQPLLEDFMIAKRHDEQKFGITQLLLNSAVCGLGLDCIPLPGNIAKETLVLLMMDVAMLSTRLNKPLTCRLMPIPGKTSEEKTDFDFEYFTNSKICDISPSSNSYGVKNFLQNNPGFLC